MFSLKPANQSIPIPSIQVLLAPGHGTVFRLLATLNFVYDISYLRYLALASPLRSVLPVTMGPGPTKGRFTRQMSPFFLAWL